MEGETVKCPLQETTSGVDTLADSRTYTQQIVTYTLPTTSQTYIQTQVYTRMMPEKYGAATEHQRPVMSRADARRWTNGWKGGSSLAVPVSSARQRH
jgi:hypothetical protein